MVRVNPKKIVHTVTKISLCQPRRVSDHKCTVLLEVIRVLD